MTDDYPKARTLANGIEVWCSFDKLVPVGELKPNPRNPNTHPQRQIELLAKNIRYFGWRQTITVSNLTGLIVSGHGRLMAAIGDFLAAAVIGGPDTVRTIRRPSSTVRSSPCTSVKPR